MALDSEYWYSAEEELKFMLKKQSHELNELKNLVNDKFLDKFD